MTCIPRIWINWLHNLRDPAQEDWSFTNDTTLLINLEEDKGESNNLIEDYPEKAEKMQSLHREWIDRLETEKKEN